MPRHPLNNPNRCITYISANLRDHLMSRWLYTPKYRQGQFGINQPTTKPATPASHEVPGSCGPECLVAAKRKPSARNTHYPNAKANRERLAKLIKNNAPGSRAKRPISLAASSCGSVYVKK